MEVEVVGVKWEGDAAGRFLARHFFVWFVHGLELLQQACGGEDVGRAWRHA